MDQSSKFRVLDETGHPIDPRIEQALVSLIPRFHRHYPAFRDDVSVVEILEEAGRKIGLRERRSGPIEHLHAYAWVTLRTIAASRLRRGEGRLARRTFGAESGGAAIEGAAAKAGGPEEIERSILLRELLERLSPDERLVCMWKKAGYTSQEIAERRGTTAGAVDVMLSRIRQKVRESMETRMGDAQRGPMKDDRRGKVGGILPRVRERKAEGGDGK
jgi:RNA polymerase sigma factor (sigma-70 family)